MISNGWDLLEKEQKMDFCRCVGTSINTECISKADWETIFLFLMEQVDKQSEV